MSNTVISVERLSKRYLVGHRSVERQRYTALRDVITREARNFARKTVDVVRGRQIVQGDEVEEFWALNDVSFEVKSGEVLGIIGRNGAGKSTLLKIVSRITEPSAGRVRLCGRVASLLEVGTGFHPELTGRENIFLNGAILGMSRREIRRKFEEIVAFAEVEKFLDTPVKYYSSGMYVRLAFSVAAHLDPEILIVDEVLAVGDAEFQRKCLGKMHEVSGHDHRTVLFVSHNLGIINQLCRRCVWLDRGQVRMIGISTEVISAYVQDGITQNGEHRWTGRDMPGDESFKLRSVRVCQPPGITNPAINMAKPFDIEIETEAPNPVSDVAVSIRIVNAAGQILLHTADLVNPEIERRQTGIRRLACRIPAHTLNIGSYNLIVAADVPNVRVIFEEDQALNWSVEAIEAKIGRYDPRTWQGIIGPEHPRWFISKPA
jgi:lipopolysaccharide transport system ATP-binding protein